MFSVKFLWHVQLHSEPLKVPQLQEVSIKVVQERPILGQPDQLSLFLPHQLHLISVIKTCSHAPLCQLGVRPLSCSLWIRSSLLPASLPRSSSGPPSIQPSLTLTLSTCQPASPPSALAPIVALLPHPPALSNKWVWPLESPSAPEITCSLVCRMKSREKLKVDLQISSVWGRRWS